MALTPTTWSTTDKVAAVTLSNGNLTATSSTTATMSVRSIYRTNNGKLYWEATIGGSVYSFTAVGIANSNMTLTGWTSFVGVAALFSDGGISVNSGTAVATVAAPVIGSVVCFAVDVVAKLMWVRTGPTGSWNAVSGTANDPATGVGGVSIAALSSPYYLMWGSTNNANQAVTINTGATAFSGAVPSGFTGGFGFRSYDAATTWNPADLSAVTLSGGNLIASATGSGGVRSISGASSGKWYYEITIGTSPSGGSYGVATVGKALASGNGVGSAVAFGTSPTAGNFYVDGTSLGAISGGLGAAGVVGVALDLDNKRIWIRPHYTQFYNNSGTSNPSTNTGGFDISAMATPQLPYFSSTGSGIGATANFGATQFAGDPPAGFVEGYGAVTTMQATQALAEQWLSTDPTMRVTQALLEQWITVQTVNPQMIVTQALLEQWISVAEVVIAAQQARVLVMA